MTLFLIVSIAAIVSGLLSLLGGLFYLANKKFQKIDLKLLISFAAGTMLAAALLDIIPEALEMGEPEVITISLLAGIVAFFIGEKTLIWHHHSHDQCCEHVKPVGLLVVVGDSLHNFLDGVVIALTFSISIELGIVTTLAIIAHEIPQELGDFAILINSGVEKSKVLLFNVVSSFAALFGAWLALIFKTELTSLMPYLLGFAAGNFIYIAAADLIPEIHHESNRFKMIIQILSLLFGVFIIGFIISLVE